MHLYEKERGQDRRGRGVEGQTMKKERSVCLHLSVCLRMRGTERDGAREGASQKRESEREAEGGELI